VKHGQTYREAINLISKELGALQKIVATHAEHFVGMPVGHLDYKSAALDLNARLQDAQAWWDVEYPMKRGRYPWAKEVSRSTPVPAWKRLETLMEVRHG